MHLISPVASAAVNSKVWVLLLLIDCLMYFPSFVGVLCLSLLCYALLCVHSSFAIILKRKRKQVSLLLLSYRCIVTKMFCRSSSQCLGWSAVYDCGVSLSYLLTFLNFLELQMCNADLSLRGQILILDFTNNFVWV